MGTSPILTLPINAASYLAVVPSGVAALLESGANTYAGSTRVRSADTSTLAIECIDSSGTYAINAGITATIPFTWGENDVLRFIANYRI